MAKQTNLKNTNELLFKLCWEEFWADVCQVLADFLYLFVSSVGGDLRKNFQNFESSGGNLRFCSAPYLSTDYSGDLAYTLVIFTS